MSFTSNTFALLAQAEDREYVDTICQNTFAFIYAIKPKQEQLRVIRELYEFFVGLLDVVDENKDLLVLCDICAGVNKETDSKASLPRILYDIYILENPLMRKVYYRVLIQYFTSGDFPEIHFEEIDRRLERAKQIRVDSDPGNRNGSIMVNYVSERPNDGNKTGPEDPGKKFENLLLRWKKKLFIQLWLQEKSMYFYSTIHNVLSYLIIFISTGSSATLFSTENTFIKYIIGGLSLGTGILTAVMRQMKPAEKYQQHLMITNQYQTLLRKIDTHLSMDIYENTDEYKKFKQEIEDEMNVLLRNQLTPPLYILHLFQQKYGSIDSMMYGNEIINLVIKETLSSKHLEFIKHKIKKDVTTIDDIRMVIRELEELKGTNVIDKSMYVEEDSKKKERNKKSCFQFW
jgi:hypothetical protein